MGLDQANGIDVRLVRRYSTQMYRCSRISNEGLANPVALAKQLTRLVSVDAYGRYDAAMACIRRRLGGIG